jgi:hypothetical protein
MIFAVTSVYEFGLTAPDISSKNVFASDKAVGNYFDAGSRQTTFYCGPLFHSAPRNVSLPC